jgi:hypothetical protein
MVTTHRWESTNSKPRGPIIMITQRETGNNSSDPIVRSYYFITLFSSRCTVLLFQGRLPPEHYYPTLVSLQK